MTNKELYEKYKGCDVKLIGSYSEIQGFVCGYHNDNDCHNGCLVMAVIGGEHPGYKLSSYADNATIVDYGKRGYYYAELKDIVGYEPPKETPLKRHSRHRHKFSPIRFR